MRLSAKIILALCLVGAASLGILLTYSLTRVESIVIETRNSDMLTMCREVGKEAARMVNEGYSSIGLLATNPELAAFAENHAEIMEHLKRTQLFHPIIKDMTLLDMQGRVAASVFYSFRGDLSATDWFRRAAAGHRVLSKVHAVIYPFDVVMTAAIPVLHPEEGRVASVLVGQFDLEPVSRLVNGVDFGPRGRTYIVDDRGYIVAGPDPDKLLEPLPYPVLTSAVSNRREAVMVLEGDEPLVAAIAPTFPASEEADPGWSVVMIQPRSYAYAPAFSIRRGIIYAGLASLALVILLGVLFGNHIQSRIRPLAEAARRMGLGDFSLAGAGLSETGRDELGELGRALGRAGRELAASQREIRTYQENLERLVEERTADLKDANDMLTMEIQERVEAEEKLARLNVELGRRVEERTRDLARKAEELEEANDRLTELDALKTSFLTSVSHELRTPLTSIMGFAKLISRDLAVLNSENESGQAQREKISSRIRENIAIVSGEAERLTRLINDVLDLSRIESGRMSWTDKPVRVQSCVDKAVTSLSGILTEKPDLRLEVEMSEDIPKVYMDSDRLCQVLINLLSNAAKFTPKGTVRVTASTNHGKELVFSVADTGVGIAPDELPRIFDSFHQSSLPAALGEKPAGTGLGLAISRQIVEHYGGRIWAESTPGEGSTFHVALPVFDPAA